MTNGLPIIMRRFIFLMSWQYSSKGRVDGIKGDVDMNVCMKDYGQEQ